jgi:hypothetical protein
MARKCALHMIKAQSAAPRAEDSCQSMTRSGTMDIILVIVSMTLVLARFRDSVLATPRHAFIRSSIAFPTSSYASVRVSLSSYFRLNPSKVGMYKYFSQFSDKIYEKMDLWRKLKHRTFLMEDTFVNGPNLRLRRLQLG